VAVGEIIHQKIDYWYRKIQQKKLKVRNNIRSACASSFFSFYSPSDILSSMSPQPKPSEYANQLLASQDFFARSTRVLEEADSAFRPQEGMMTVAQQVAHTAQTLDWFIEGASRPEGFDLDFEKHAKALDAVTSLTAARQTLATAYAKAVAFLRSRSAEDLARPLPPGPVMGGQPITDIVWAMVEHTAHHRGALTVYSRQLGKVPPMPYGG
jgi:uncharacterized damage-inducible protein DinB